MKRERLRVFLAVGLGTMGAIAPLTQSHAILADNAPIDYVPSQGSAQTTLAQNIELSLGCRQTNVSTGVYVQPNLNSAAQGVLTLAQTVRLESKGEGWARINQPLIGWVQSKYLTPAVSCDLLNGTTTIQNPPGQQIMALPPEAPASKPQQDTADSAPIKVTCDVLPADGLAVRSQPTAEGRYLTTIAPGTHEFQFTREARVTQSADGDRRWVYITAPSTGWITLGLEGAPDNLGGQECG